MRRFTEEEKQRAIDLYFEEELTTMETVKRMGYPTRQNLERWLSKDPRYGETFRHGFYPVKIKVQVVELYRSGKYSAGELARKFNIGSLASVLHWVKLVEKSGYDALIPKTRSAAMPKPQVPKIPDDVDALRQRCEELEMNNAILRETIEILKKTQASIQEI